MPTKQFEKMIKNINSRLYIKYNRNNQYRMAKIMLKNGEKGQSQLPDRQTILEYHQDKLISACSSEFIADVPVPILGHPRGMKHRTFSEVIAVMKAHGVI